MVRMPPFYIAAHIILFRQAMIMRGVKLSNAIRSASAERPAPNPLRIRGQEVLDDEYARRGRQPCSLPGRGHDS
jgi:hypothetical protein